METIEQLTSTPEGMKEFQRERLELELTELICRLMEENNISKAELASRLNTSRPYVTKLLRDGSNMTVKTISDVFFAFGKSLRLVDRPISIWNRELLVIEVLDSVPLATEAGKAQHDEQDLPSLHSDDDLKRGLIENLKHFFIELGLDLCLVGSPYFLHVGGRDLAIDLLFFNRTLNALVAIEIKTGTFKPEYLDQLKFYLEALDRNVKMPHEKPSVGVLLCAGKDHEIVEYALSRSSTPALVAEYQTRLPDKKLLQAKLHEFYERAQEQAGMRSIESQGLPAKGRVKKGRKS